RAHRVVIRARKIDIERLLPRPARTVLITNDDVGSSAGDVFVDRLPNSRFERDEIARQVNHDVALLSIHRIELNAKLRAAVIVLAAPLSGHRSHFDLSFKPKAVAA